MHINPVAMNGDAFSTERVPVVNKTGAATVAGGVYALDIAQADADTSGATDKARASLTHIVAVSADNIGGVLVVVEKIVPDNESVLAVVSGPCKPLVNGAVVVKNRLKAVAAQAYLQAASAAAGSTDIGVAIALEANDAATTNRRQVLFSGICFNVSINAATT